MVQTSIISDFNSGTFRMDTYEKIKILNTNFPSLSATAYPMYGFLAKYHIAFKEYYNALEILNLSEDSNPYLRVKESSKAIIFNNLGIRDSAYFYSKIAYDNLPNNSANYQQYLTELVYRKEIDTIKKVFRESKSKDQNIYWQIFLASVINIKDENDTEIDSIAKEALKLFKGNKKLKDLSSFILYGQDNVIKSKTLFNEGMHEFERLRFKIAAEKFYEASLLNPVEYVYYENAGMSLIKAEDYEAAIPFFKKVIDSELIINPATGKSEYGLGVAFNELGKLDEACKYFNKSFKFNYKPALREISKYCGSK